MSAEQTLLIIGTALVLAGLLIYSRSERTLNPGQREALGAALSNPPPIVTALYIVGLLGSFGVLLVAAMVVGLGPRIVILAPGCVCVATLLKIFVATKSLQFGSGWRSPFLLGLTLTGMGLSLGLAAFAAIYLL